MPSAERRTRQARSHPGGVRRRTGPPPRLMRHNDGTAVPVRRCGVPPVQPSPGGETHADGRQGAGHPHIGRSTVTTPAGSPARKPGQPNRPHQAALVMMGLGVASRIARDARTHQAAIVVAVVAAVAVAAARESEANRPRAWRRGTESRPRGPCTRSSPRPRLRFRRSSQGRISDTCQAPSVSPSGCSPSGWPWRATSSGPGEPAGVTVHLAAPPGWSVKNVHGDGSGTATWPATPPPAPSRSSVRGDFGFRGPDLRWPNAARCELRQIGDPRGERCWPPPADVPMRR